MAKKKRPQHPYRHRDYSVLLQQMQQNQPQEPAKEDIPPVIPKELVTPESRRRDSLLSNPKMRYILSKSTGLVHDRDCPLARQIPASDFEMLDCFPMDRPKCPDCYRQSLLRAGLTHNDRNKMELYTLFFNRFQVFDEALFELLIRNKAILSDVQQDRVTVQVRQDKWQIQFDGRDLTLHHNNYDILPDGKRYFPGGFHPQTVGSHHTFNHFVNIICQYSWDEHKHAYEQAKASRIARSQAVRQEQERAAQLLASRQRAFRLALNALQNHMQEKRFSLLYTYHTFVDCNHQSLFLLSRYGIPLEFLHTSYLGDPDAGYTLVRCRVRRRYRKAFQESIEKLKEYSVDGYYFEYADHCANCILQ